MSDQGGCSCVQDISVTLCEKYRMFWEVSGIDSEVIRLFCGIRHHWNTPRGYSFSGFLSLFVLFFSPLLVTLVFCTLVSDSSS